ncbi:hypothetical protein [Mycolicibacterium sphagni]|nr:hypothetical protein [Mycolicibacterium sphagni]
MDSDQGQDAGDPAPDPSDAHDRATAIARAVVGVSAGAAVGITTRDIGLGITTAAALVSILGEVMVRPPR